MVELTIDEDATIYWSNNDSLINMRYYHRYYLTNGILIQFVNSFYYKGHQVICKNKAEYYKIIELMALW